MSTKTENALCNVMVYLTRRTAGSPLSPLRFLLGLVDLSATVCKGIPAIPCYH